MQVLLMSSNISRFELLKESGFSVCIAQSLKEAGDMASQKTSDVAVLDLETSQVEDFFSIYASSFSSLPIILISNNVDITFILKALSARVFAILGSVEQTNLKKILDAIQANKEKEDHLEVISATPSWIEVNFPASPIYSVRMINFLEHIISPFFPKEINKILMAYRELIQNAMEHGSGFCAQKKIFLHYLKTQHFILLQIQDEGPGFDPKILPHAAIGCTGKDAVKKAMRYRKEMGMRPGGLGISYVLGVMDEIIYNQKCNSVVIIKYLDFPYKKQDSE